MNYVEETDWGQTSLSVWARVPKDLCVALVANIIWWGFIFILGASLHITIILCKRKSGRRRRREWGGVDLHLDKICWCGLGDHCPTSSSAPDVEWPFSLNCVTGRKGERACLLWFEWFTLLRLGSCPFFAWPRIYCAGPFNMVPGCWWRVCAFILCEWVCIGRMGLYCAKVCASVIYVMMTDWKDDTRGYWNGW